MASTNAEKAVAEQRVVEKGESDAAVPVIPPLDTSVGEKDILDAAATDSESASAPTPYDWPRSRKIIIAMTVSLAQLVATSSGSFMAPALKEIAAATHMTPTETQISFSIYMLGMGFAPFVIGPASEVFGRKPVWLTGTTCYAVFNAICPVGHSKVVLIIFRFLSGTGASSGVVLTGPILADMFRKEQRGLGIAIGAALPYLGPALGPIIGGLASQHLAWPWLFWIMSLIEAGVIVLGFFVIQETYGPVLRRRREKALKAAQSNDDVVQADDSVADEANALVSKTARRFLLPARMLLRRPVVQTMSFLNGISFGVYVLVLSYYATLFSTQYHENPTSSSLHYIALALGAIIAGQSGGFFLDRSYAYLKHRAKVDEGQPEFRIPLLAIGAVVETVGLFWLGWSAQADIPWIMVDIGAFIFTVGNFAAAQAALAYILDEFGDDSASANGAVRILSYLLGFLLPLPAPAMFRALGYGWGTTLLAFIWVAFALPAVICLWFWGPQIRSWGREKEEPRPAA